MAELFYNENKKNSLSRKIAEWKYYVALMTTERISKLFAIFDKNWIKTGPIKCKNVIAVLIFFCKIKLQIKFF